MNFSSLSAGLTNDLNRPMVLVPEKRHGREVLCDLRNLVRCEKRIALTDLANLAPLIRFRLSLKDCNNSEERLFLANLQDSKLLANDALSEEREVIVSSKTVRSILLEKATAGIGLRVANTSVLGQLNWPGMAREGVIYVRDKYLLDQTAQSPGLWFGSMMETLKAEGLSKKLVLLTKGRANLAGKEKLPIQCFPFESRDEWYNHPRWILTQRFGLFVDAGLLPSCERSLMGLMPQSVTGKLRQLLDRFLDENDVNRT